MTAERTSQQLGQPCSALESSVVYLFYCFSIIFLKWTFLLSLALLQGMLCISCLFFFSALCTIYEEYICMVEVAAGLCFMVFFVCKALDIK